METNLEISKPLNTQKKIDTPYFASLKITQRLY